MHAHPVAHATHATAASGVGSLRLATTTWSGEHDDMESWLDGRRSWGAQRATETMVVWQRIRRRRPGAKLVCLDLQPYATSQAPTRSDILNVGGFSDRVFPVIDEFVRHGASPDHWVDTIRRTAV